MGVVTLPPPTLPVLCVEVSRGWSVHSCPDDSFFLFIQLVSDCIVTFLYPATIRVVGVFGDILPDFSFPAVSAMGGGEGGTLVLIFIGFSGRGLAVDDDDGGVGVGGRGFGTDDDSGVGGRGLVTDDDDGVGGRGLGTDDDDDDGGANGRGFVADDDDDGGGGSGFVIADVGNVLLILDVDDPVDLLDDVIDAAFSSSSSPSSSILSSLDLLFPGCFTGEMGLLSLAPRVTVPTVLIGLELVALAERGTSIFVPSSSLVDMDRGRIVGFVGLCELG